MEQNLQMKRESNAGSCRRKRAFDSHFIWRFFGTKSLNRTGIKRWLVSQKGVLVCLGRNTRQNRQDLERNPSGGKPRRHATEPSILPTAKTIMNKHLPQKGTAQKTRTKAQEKPKKTTAANASRKPQKNDVLRCEMIRRKTTGGEKGN